VFRTPIEAASGSGADFPGIRVIITPRLVKPAETGQKRKIHKEHDAEGEVVYRKHFRDSGLWLFDRRSYVGTG
jgi:hypothetical protein